MTSSDSPSAPEDRPHGYLHGFSDEETSRLRQQARVTAPRVHRRVDLAGVNRLLELGCGVSAQTELLLERWPELRVTGVDQSFQSLAAGRERLEDRADFCQADGAALPFAEGSFDGAFLCWILEHVSDPGALLTEVHRTLAPGGRLIVTEVFNSTLWVQPESPALAKYWQAFNDHQRSLGGDPDVGARLGGLLTAAGFEGVECHVTPILLDDRDPEERAQFLEFWAELSASAGPELCSAGRVTEAEVEGMKSDLRTLGHAPQSTFFYAFTQGFARRS